MAFKAVFSFFDIRWPLSGEDARDVNSISGRRVNVIEMGGKSGANSSVSKVALHHTKFALSIVLPSIKLNLLALYRLELALMCSISINVSNNARVFEVYNGVVDEELGGGRGVKNIEIVIFDPRVVEIGRGMCMCMERDGVLGVSPFADSYNMSINPNLSEGDVSCNFILSILIEEDQGVLPHITAVVLAPSDSWVIGVIKLLSELGNIGDRARSGGEGNGRVIHGEPNWFVVLYIVI